MPPTRGSSGSAAWRLVGAVSAPHPPTAAPATTTISPTGRRGRPGLALCFRKGRPDQVAHGAVPELGGRALPPGLAVPPLLADGGDPGFALRFGENGADQVADGRVRAPGRAGGARLARGGRGAVAGTTTTLAFRGSRAAGDDGSRTSTRPARTPATTPTTHGRPHLGRVGRVGLDLLQREWVEGLPARHRRQQGGQRGIMAGQGQVGRAHLAGGATGGQVGAQVAGPVPFHHGARGEGALDRARRVAVPPHRLVRRQGRARREEAAGDGFGVGGVVAAAVGAAAVAPATAAAALAALAPAASTPPTTVVVVPALRLPVVPAGSVAAAAAAVVKGRAGRGGGVVGGCEAAAQAATRGGGRLGSAVDARAGAIAAAAAAAAAATAIPLCHRLGAQGAGDPVQRGEIPAQLADLCGLDVRVGMSGEVFFRFWSSPSLPPFSFLSHLHVRREEVLVHPGDNAGSREGAPHLAVRGLVLPQTGRGGGVRASGCAAAEAAVIAAALEWYRGGQGSERVYANLIWFDEELDSCLAWGSVPSGRGSRAGRQGQGAAEVRGGLSLCVGQVLSPLLLFQLTARPGPARLPSHPGGGDHCRRS